MITNEQLAELASLARAATPGPWHTDRMPYSERILSENAVYVARAFGMRERDLNATYIAAANPSTVLELVARIAELEAPPILSAAELVVGNRYWARPRAGMGWHLTDVMSMAGVEYGMAGWQFVGPVIPPAA